MSRPTPETKCLRCGATYREVRAEQQKFGSPLLCGTTDYWGEMEDEYANHVWTKPRTPSITDVIYLVVDSLDAGRTTDEILRELGIQYDSLVKRLEGTPAGARFQALRREEWSKRRVYARRGEPPEKRCAHGWWSKDGQCNHTSVGISDRARKFSDSSSRVDN